MSKLRTFIAVAAPSKMRGLATTLIQQLAQTEATVKWVPEQNLHWTLKFLGDVDDRLVPDICDCLSEAVMGIAPFEAAAQRVGAFPSSSRPRTVWLGTDAGTSEFVQLHDALEGPLGDLGFREEHRRFQPHMTLGRVRRSPHGIGQLAEKIAQFSDFDAGSMRVSQIILYSSLLDRTGPAYQVLGRADLQA